ncbi:hypothetical protein [Marinobacter sp.]|uniref:hypothetical protein n=1 Tax=Marinobacter sp. TaxID=50741 RepID=UPI0034A12B06
MLRVIAVVVLMIGLVGIAVFGPKWLMSITDDGPTATQVCDLQTGPCQWKMNGAPWVAELERGDVGDQGQEYRLRLHTRSAPERLMAVLKGESMYLGEYPVPLSQVSSDNGDSGIETWEAHFTAPFCTTDPGMTWRIDLQAHNSPMNELPVKMLFQAEGRGS